MLTVLVDYDDTLNDTCTIFFNKLDGFFSLRGRELYRIFLEEVHRGIIEKKYPELHDDLEAHVKLLFQHLKKEYDQSLGKEILRKYVEAEQETWMKPRFFLDVKPFLTEAKERGYRLCLTTGPHSIEKADAVKKKLGSIFFRAFGDDTLGIRKTDPRYYELVLQEVGSKPENTVCIGDTLTHDVEPAAALGIKTIWINRKNETNCSSIKPDLEVENLTQALESLTHLKNG